MILYLFSLQLSGKHFFNCFKKIILPLFLLKDGEGERGGFSDFLLKGKSTVCIAKRSTMPHRPSTIMAAIGAQGKPGSIGPAGTTDSGVKGAGGWGWVVGWGGVGVGCRICSCGAKCSFDCYFISTSQAIPLNHFPSSPGIL